MRALLRGAGGAHGERLHLVSRDVRILDGFAGSTCQSAHPIVVRLYGIFGVFAFAEERVFSKRGGQQSPFAHDGNANA